MNTAVKIGVAAVLAVGIIWFAKGYNSKNEQEAVAKKQEQQAAAAAADQQAQADQAAALQKAMQDLKIEDVKMGTGAEAKTGQMVTVHYVGTFDNGSKFDSSRDRGEPFTFQLGAGAVIQGWDLGVAGMKVGGLRKLTIPSDLGYGPNGYGPIPGGATLHFEIELISVK